jgi:hypothetical protein
VRYGGQGTAPLHPETEWHMAGEAAVLLGSVPVDPHPDDSPKAAEKTPAGQEGR